MILRMKVERRGHRAVRVELHRVATPGEPGRHIDTVYLPEPDWQAIDAALTLGGDQAGLTIERTGNYYTRDR
jgi:hypothetical protein